MRNSKHVPHHPTQRAPDWWDSPRFQAVFVAQAGPVKVALSRPAHQRVTLTVGLPMAMNGYDGSTR